MTTTPKILAALAIAAALPLSAQTNPVQTDPVQTTPVRPGVVLVELFTSEGCSDCPPADQLLAQMTGKKTSDGQTIIGISEHVTYWNHLGWKDPFSADEFTDRQHAFSNRFGLDSVYTPQIVVNGREQFVGGKHTALAAAFKTEAARPQIDLQITAVQATAKDLTVTWSAAALPRTTLRLVAVLVDDTDSSAVLKGENSGKQLTHAFVARSLTPLGKLAATAAQTATLPLPPSFLADPEKPRHIVLFAQEGTNGPILGADAKPLKSPGEH